MSESREGGSQTNNAKDADKDAKELWLATLLGAEPRVLEEWQAEKLDATVTGPLGCI